MGGTLMIFGNRTDAWSLLPARLRSQPLLAFSLVLFLPGPGGCSSEDPDTKETRMALLSQFTLQTVAPTSGMEGTIFKFTSTLNNPIGGSTVRVTYSLKNLATQARVALRRFDVPPNGRNYSLENTFSPATYWDDTPPVNYEVSAWANDGSPPPTPITYTVDSALPPNFLPTFAMITTTWSLPNDHNTSYSNGAAWADVNKDGCLDLYLPIRAAAAKLMIQNCPGGASAR